jgi:hypothetical protein
LGGTTLVLLERSLRANVDTSLQSLAQAIAENVRRPVALGPGLDELVESMMVWPVKPLLSPVMISVLACVPVVVPVFVNLPVPLIAPSPAYLREIGRSGPRGGRQ